MEFLFILTQCAFLPLFTCGPCVAPRICCITVLLKPSRHFCLGCVGPVLEVWQRVRHRDRTGRLCGSLPLHPIVKCFPHSVRPARFVVVIRHLPPDTPETQTVDERNPAPLLCPPRPPSVILKCWIRGTGGAAPTNKKLTPAITAR